MLLTVNMLCAKDYALIITIGKYENTSSLKGAHQDNIIFRKILKKCKFFLLDSGAFSMLYGNAKVEVDEYVDKYIDFINRHDVTNFMELDLYDIIGTEKTEQIRLKIENKTGKRVIPVLQKSQGLDYYMKLVKEYDYVAIGGIAVKKINYVKIFSKLLNIAKQNNCKVHGLGYMAMKGLPKLKFYSVDSTTWLSPMMYGGHIHKFEDGIIKAIYPPKGSRGLHDKIRKHQLTEWLKFQKYAEKHY